MLKFSDWDKKYYSIDESLGEDFYNWLSKNFGGKIGKIEGILSDLVYGEKEYAKEWEKVQREISSMEDQIDTGEISAEEEKSFRKEIRKKKAELEIADRRRVQKVRTLNDQAKKIIDGNPRVNKYWEIKKAEAELSVIENLYNISKTLPSRRIEDSFYREYTEAQDRLTRKRRGIEDLEGKIKSETTETPETREKEKTSKEVAKTWKLVSMTISQFKSEVKEYSPEQRKEVKRALIDKKNLALNELRSLRRDKSKYLDRSISQRERKDVLNKYNPKIYEMGEIVDKIREKISYLDA